MTEKKAEIKEKKQIKVAPLVTKTTCRTKRMVEIGRVCMINYGEDAGKICVIIDVVDATSALVDGPMSVTGVHRQIVNFKRLSLSPFKLTIQRNQRPKLLEQKMKAAKIMDLWSQTTWGKKIAAQKLKRSYNDFDRFKNMIVHKKQMYLIGREVAALKRALPKQKKAEKKQEKKPEKKKAEKKDTKKKN
eukprot:TRINITY_DN10271_c0_g1_i1.p1 TRINITY_DN10271_c0_g1~~TRINITY_DN10271_c0_g1_i1.p1  ORF type:complete len:189 (+),score=71.66 TRINITY_DN10271_c0_g1_i1:59-625(+)